MLAMALRLLWFALATRAAIPADLDITGVTEIDVIFPRNDTYAPMPVMPVVFAVRNPEAARLLYSEFSYTLVNGDDPSSPAISRSVTPDQTQPKNISYYTVDGIADRFNKPGRWRFTWALSYANCSLSSDPQFQNNSYDKHDEVSNGFHWGFYDNAYSTLLFTVQEGGRQPDLVSISGGDRCNDTQALVFSVDKQLEVATSLSGHGIMTPCPHFASPTPSPQPCLASLDASVASSISTAITSTACRSSVPTAFTCPPTEDDKSGVNSQISNLSWSTFAAVCIIWAVW